ncbi:SET domain-containing protein-lysine N-methyltransferase [Geodermatophilus sp. SYSU D01106]
MAKFKFHSRVMLLRTLHWLGCRFPVNGRSTPTPSELPSSPDLLVAPSRIPGAGLGAFARRPFAPGEEVSVYSGTTLSTVQALRTPDWRYVVGLGKSRKGRRVWIDARTRPEVLARYVNHHFDAERRNIRTDVRPDDGTWVMTASRPIAEGDELYCDYGSFYWHVVDRETLRGRSGR